ncbi:hypothetical protein SAMN05421810_102275 [Amycolatopsis arida]|uniref:PPE family protein n=1 Tax=Amycolatopsis arida TaxID=587909 RepID=A0A1I5PHA2_9PSEU|nr:hypothetical protein [Amycolatopsis arida]TDX98483.1 hypothetical protein CLV69_101275 [Amycolatopsis arida]SFP32876.1 hypothetical protein SAMN05421810_102275 [Amycolatopsis arida]
MGEEQNYVPRKYEAQVFNETAGSPLGQFSVFDPERVAGQYAQAERDRLMAGQEFRPGAEPPVIDYRSRPHEELYRYVHDGVDPGAVDEQGMIANDLGNAQKELAEGFRQAAAKEEAAWQGEGAEAAFTFFKQLADWSDSAGDATHLAANRLSQQSAAVVVAKNNMPEPSGRSVEATMNQANEAFTNGDVYAGAVLLQTAETEARKQQEAHEHAAAVLTARDQAFYSTASTQPTFAPPPSLDGSTATVPSGDMGTRAAGFSGGPSIPVGGAPGTPVPTGGTPAPGTSSGAGPVHAGGPPVGNPPGGGGVPRVPAANLGALGAMPPGGSNLGRLGSETTRGTPNRGSFANRAGKFVSGSAGGRGGAGGRVAGGGAGGKGTPIGRGPGGPPLAGGKGSGLGEPGRGPNEIARGAQAAAGSKSTGPMGAGGPAAGRGNKDEDKDHKRAEYLQEENPNEYFGTDGLGKTTPPVIGETKPRRD